MKLHAIVAGATPFKDLPLVDTAWDAGAAEKAMDGEAELTRGHFWKDTSADADPETKSSYKLPFVNADGDAVWGAVTAAAAAIQGARGGVSIPSADVDGVKNHIAKYYAKRADSENDPSIKPPWEAAAITAALAVDGMEWEAVALDLSRPTSDGREIVQDGATIRKPPLALLYTPELGMGHDGAIQVGTIQQAEIDGSLVRMAGTWLDSPDPEVAAVIADVEQRVQNEDGLSVSVDLAVQKATLTLTIPGEVDQEIEQADETGTDVTVEIPLVDTETEVLRIEQCEVIGLTIVTQPAQDGLSITWLGDAQPDAAAEPGADQPVTASAASPPHDWFTMPEPDEPTPLTILDTGQVYGHVAVWGTCHTGNLGTCLEPPGNPSGEYPWFNLGVRETSSGEVTVGQITMDADHARLTLGIKDAHDHYANSALAVADVHCSEGEIGPWVCGAVRPGVTDDQVEAARSLKLSGDWRPTDDGMELIAALAVPYPGFIVPRASLVAAAGEPHVAALVAAGVVQDPHPEGSPQRVPASRAKLRVMAAQARGGLTAAAELAHSRGA